MSNRVGGRARAVFSLGALVVASGAVATASCTYDYQGALATSSAASGGGSSTSSGATRASTTSAGGQGGSGGATGGATQSSSTGGPIPCPPLAGQITNVANDPHGSVAWAACGSGSVGLTQNLEADDLAVDCVALTPMNKISEWLRVSFAFAGLPADAVVTEIKISIRRGANADLDVEDRRAWIQPLETLEVVQTTIGPWPQDPTWHDYTLDKTYAPGEVSGADLVLQVTDLSNNTNVTAKVGYAIASVSYSASVCP